MDENEKPIKINRIDRKKEYILHYITLHIVRICTYASEASAYQIRSRQIKTLKSLQKII